MAGLPDGVRALLFDLDGVLTKTAVVHARAWKQMFDEFLRARDPIYFRPFSDEDYLRYVDGKPREDGVRAFLASRDITVSEDEIEALGARKNELVVRLIDQHGVEVYPDAVAYLDHITGQNLHLAVVSSSRNCRRVLEVTGLTDRFEQVVDGTVIGRERLAGKPAPDSFLYAARQFELGPESAVVFEDAIVGVQAGRAGGFAGVVGVNRVSRENGAKLAAVGATIVVTQLTELLGQEASR